MFQLKLGTELFMSCSVEVRGRGVASSVVSSALKWGSVRAHAMTLWTYLLFLYLIKFFSFVGRVDSPWQWIRQGNDATLARNIWRRVRVSVDARRGRVWRLAVSVCASVSHLIPDHLCLASLYICINRLYFLQHLLMLVNVEWMNRRSCKIQLLIWIMF